MVCECVHANGATCWVATESEAFLLRTKYGTLTGQKWSEANPPTPNSIRLSSWSPLKLPCSQQNSLPPPHPLEHHTDGVQRLVHWSGGLCEILGMLEKTNQKGEYDGDVMFNQQTYQKLWFNGIFHGIFFWDLTSKNSDWMRFFLIWKGDIMGSIVIFGKIALGEKGILNNKKKNDSFSKNSLGGKA